MSYRVRQAAHGEDRRHGRSLAETLTAGNSNKKCKVCGITQNQYNSPTSPLRGEPCESDWGTDEHSWR